MEDRVENMLGQILGRSRGRVLSGDALVKNLFSPKSPVKLSSFVGIV
jgi:hypothetical protein